MPLTLVLLLLTYLLAVTSSGIWVVLSLVGSSASTFMGFVFPACIILVVCVSGGGREEPVEWACRAFWRTQHDAAEECGGGALVVLVRQ